MALGGGHDGEDVPALDEGRAQVHGPEVRHLAGAEGDVFHLRIVLAAGAVLQGNLHGGVGRARHRGGVIGAAGGEAPGHLDVVGGIGLIGLDVVEGALDRFRIVEDDASGQGRRTRKGGFHHGFRAAAHEGELHEGDEGLQAYFLFQRPGAAGGEQQLRRKGALDGLLLHGNRPADAVGPEGDGPVGRVQEAVVGGLRHAGGAAEFGRRTPSLRGEDVGGDGSGPVHREGGDLLPSVPAVLDPVLPEGDGHAGVPQHAVRLVERAGRGEDRGQKPGKKETSCPHKRLLLGESADPVGRRRSPGGTGEPEDAGHPFHAGGEGERLFVG